MNIESIKVIHNVSYLLGIRPTLWSAYYENGRRVSDHFRGVFFILLFVAATALRIYAKIYVFPPAHPTVFYTYAACAICVTTINLVAIYLINLRYGKKVQTIVRTLRNLEVFVIHNDRIPKDKRTFQGVFFVRSFFIFAFMVVSAIFNNFSMGTNAYKWLFLKDIQDYHAFITSYLMTEHAGMIGKRMKDLNEHLSNFVGRKHEIVVNIMAAKGSGLTKKFNVNVISKAFVTISQLVDLYNDVYGPLFVLYSCNIIVNIMVPMNMAFLYSENIPVYKDRTFGVEVVIFCVIWLLFPLFCGLKLFMVCGLVENEMRNVPKVCCTLIKSLSYRDVELKTELEEYAAMADQLKPSFSAAGLYNVNLGLILPVLGTAATYIIVLLQFHNLSA